MAYLAGYNRYQIITINADAFIAADLSNFPVGIHVPSSNTAFWAREDGNGDYARFTASDGTTLLDFETQSYDATGDDAIWWVDVSTLSSSVDTEIRLYYEADTPSDGANKSGTWDSTFEAVAHFDVNNPNGAFDDAADATTHNDQTNTGTTDAAGQIGRAIEFISADSDKVLFANESNFDVGTSTDFSYSFWLKTTTSATQYIAEKREESTAIGYAALIIGGKIRGLVRDSVGTTFADSTTSVNTGAWFHVAINNDRSGNLEVFINGVSEATVAISSVGTLDNTHQLALGVQQSAATDQSYLDGIIDEFRFSKGLRTVNWWLAEYQSGLTTWATFGTEVDTSLLVSAQVTYTNADDAVAISVILPALLSIGYTNADDITAIDAALDIPTVQVSYTNADDSVSIQADIENRLSIGYTNADDIVGIQVGLPVDINVQYSNNDDTTSIIGVVSSVIESFQAELFDRDTQDPITGLTTVYIEARRASDGYRWDFSDSLFKATVPTTPTLVLAEVDATNEGGLYESNITTTTWEGWIKFKWYYDDGSFTYRGEDEAYYSDGVRSNGAWSIAEIQRIDVITAKTDQMIFDKENELNVNIKSVVDVTVKGTGEPSDPWNPI